MLPDAMVYALLAALVVPAVLRVQDTWNVDAISYARIALYYYEGRFDLAVSGYFGPLFSWLMAPLLWSGVEAYRASFLVMGFSAFVFLAGSQAFLRACGLGRWQVLAGAGVIALFAVVWSVAVVTPDMLSAGLLLCGLAIFLEARAPASPWRFASGGLWLALAALAKPVMLPVGLSCLAAILILRAWAGGFDARVALRRFALGAGVLAMGVAPWALTLSLHYGKPVWSTSAAINHAIAGPDSAFGHHALIQRYHRPDGGRITSWEEPSREAYSYWSPLGSVAAAKYQMALMGANALVAARNLAQFDAFALGLILSLLACVLCLISMLSQRRRSWLERERWLIAGPLNMIVSAVYLPAYLADEARYFLAAFPMMLALGLGCAGAVLRFVLSRQTAHGDSPVVANAVVQSHAGANVLAAFFTAALFLLPYGSLGLAAAYRPPQSQSFLAGKAIAAVLEGLPDGAIASAGDVYNAAVLAAFLANRQYFGGRSDHPGEAAMLASGARYLVVECHTSSESALRRSNKARVLASGPVAQTIDPRANFVVFEVLQPQAR